jgi:hypothetical protein
MREVKQLTYDFIVVGGGLAGLCCAIGAARKGLKTALVQDRPVLGGNSSTEIRVPPSSSVEKNAWTMETGIIEEILLKERASNFDITFTGYVNSTYDLCLLDMVKQESNIDLFLSTVVHSVEVTSYENGEKAISSLNAVQLGSGQDFIFQAKQYADCTGDGEVGFLAGADYWYGREGRSEYNENLAPVIPDNEVMGATINFLARDAGSPVEFVAPDWAKTIRNEADIGYMRSIGTFSPGKRYVFAGYWWMEIGAPYHQVHETDSVRGELLSYIMGVWDYIKNYSDQKDNAANYALEWVGSIPGKRESRRLAGDAVVTEQHCLRDEQWPDRIAYAGWFLDTHIPGGLYNKSAPPEPSFIDENYKQYALVPPYTIPLRACYSRNVRNLWMAGRDISVSHVALSSVRVQCTLANIGQAVGIAAAYAIRNGISPREAASNRHVQKVQQAVIKDDIQILGIRNKDEDDIARTAKVTVSSEQELNLSEPDLTVYEELSVPRAQVFPVTQDFIEIIEVFIKNNISETRKAEASLYEINHIWDQDDGVVVKSFSVNIPANFCGWLPIPFQTKVTPNKPHRLALNKVDGVSWAHSIHQPTGTSAQYHHTCPGGSEPKNADQPFFHPDQIVIPEYKLWKNYGFRSSFSFAMRITPNSMPFGGENVNNGYAWPFDMPNLWISKEGLPLPQHIVLDFEDEKEFNTVMVSFDTNLNLLHTYMPGLWKSPVCAKEWKLYAKTDLGWNFIFHEDNNFQRRRVVRVDSVKTRYLKLEVLSTNASLDGKASERCARVYEVRIYNEVGNK